MIDRFFGQAEKLNWSAIKIRDCKSIISIQDKNKILRKYITTKKKLKELKK